MSFADCVGNVLAGRVLQLVGLLFGCVGIAHFVVWANAPARDFDAAGATGNITTAAPEILGYAHSHPAYVLAFLAGAVLLVRRP